MWKWTSGKVSGCDWEIRSAMQEEKRLNETDNYKNMRAFCFLFFFFFLASPPVNLISPRFQQSSCQIHSTLSPPFISALPPHILVAVWLLFYPLTVPSTPCPPLPHHVLPSPLLHTVLFFLFLFYLLTHSPCFLCFPSSFSLSLRSINSRWERKCLTVDALTSIKDRSL